MKMPKYYPQCLHTGVSYGFLATSKLTFIMAAVVGIVSRCSLTIERIIDTNLIQAGVEEAVSHWLDYTAWKL